MTMGQQRLVQELPASFLRPRAGSDLCELDASLIPEERAASANA
jgi:hypothetical protein